MTTAEIYEMLSAEDRVFVARLEHVTMAEIAGSVRDLVLDGATPREALRSEIALLREEVREEVRAGSTPARDL